MIEVMNSIGNVLSFDGRVIEIFECSGQLKSTRMHIQHLEAIGVHVRRKGLEIRCTSVFKQQMQIVHVDPSAQATVDELVAQVKAVRGLR